MIQVEFYSLLRLLLKQEKLTVPWETGMTVARLLESAQAAIPTPFLAKLIDTDGKLHPGTIILVDRRNILHLDTLQTPIADGAVVALFPPGAGG
jgi:molybdopterin synthase sulfur carrier subunit